MTATRSALSAEINSLLARHEMRVRAAARRFAVDAAELDLVMQETRLRVWRLAEQGTSPAEIGAGLLYRIAAGAAIDLRRRNVARREVSESAASLAPVQQTSSLDRLALRDALERCFGAMLESRRAVVAMHLRGTPREEIMQLLRWSEAKTRNLLYRGLDDLRVCLRGAGFEGGR